MYCVMDNDRDVQSRDIVFTGRLVFGTRGPRKFVWECKVSECPIIPPIESLLLEFYVVVFAAS